MTDCIFCKIAQGEIPCSRIWEDERFIAFLDINPVNPGHTLLIPKTHTDNVFDIDEENYSNLFLAAKLLSKPLQKALGAKRVGIIIEGFLVHHAHIHLIPLNHGNELDFSRARKASPEELAETARKIKQHL
ncbi:MAG: HIT family protein [Candidatus Micrarchaeota archaeon]